MKCYGKALLRSSQLGWLFRGMCPQIEMRGAAKEQSPIRCKLAVSKPVPMSFALGPWNMIVANTEEVVPEGAASFLHEVQNHVVDCLGD